MRRYAQSPSYLATFMLRRNTSVQPPGQFYHPKAPTGHSDGRSPSWIVFKLSENVSTGLRISRVIYSLRSVATGNPWAFFTNRTYSISEAQSLFRLSNKPSRQLNGTVYAKYTFPPRIHLFIVQTTIEQGTSGQSHYQTGTRYATT